MTENDNFALYLAACRQADSLRKKGEYSMAIMKLSSLQGEIEKSVRMSGEYSKDILDLYLYVFVALHAATYKSRKNSEQIASQFQSSFDFLSALPKQAHAQYALCHLCIFRSFHTLYHSHSQSTILEELENTRSLILEASRSDSLENSPMWGHFLVDAAAYAEKHKLKDTGTLLYLYEESLLYLDVYCPIDSIHSLYRYLNIRHKAVWGKAKCYLRMHEIKTGLIMLLNATHLWLNAAVLWPIHRFTNLLKKLLRAERNHL